MGEAAANGVAAGKNGGAGMNAMTQLLLAVSEPVWHTTQIDGKNMIYQKKCNNYQKLVQDFEFLFKYTNQYGGHGTKYFLQYTNLCIVLRNVPRKTQCSIHISDIGVNRTDFEISQSILPIRYWTINHSLCWKCAYFCAMQQRKYTFYVSIICR